MSNAHEHAQLSTQTRSGLALYATKKNEFGEPHTYRDLVKTASQQVPPVIDTSVVQHFSHGYLPHTVWSITAEQSARQLCQPRMQDGRTSSRSTSGQLRTGSGLAPRPWRRCSTAPAFARTHVHKFYVRVCAQARACMCLFACVCGRTAVQTSSQHELP